MFGFEDKKFGYFYLIATLYFVAIVVASFWLGESQLAWSILTSYALISAYNLVWIKSSHEDKEISEGAQFIFHIIASVTIGVSIFLVFMGHIFIGALVGALILIAMIVNQIGKMFKEGHGVGDNE